LYYGTCKIRVSCRDNYKKLTYDTFGNIISDSNTSLKVPFRFAGGLQDRDTGLVRFGFRDYDPFTGRWTAKDPILFKGGDTNLYGYVLGDPVGGIDVLGLWCISLKAETKNIVENPIGISWWKVDSIQKFAKTGILMCYWSKYQKVRRSREERTRKICYECDKADPCYGRTPLCDIKIKYGNWHTISDVYIKKVGGGSSSGFVTGLGRAECGFGPSPYLPHNGL